MNTINTAKKPLEIFILIDALGWEYIKDRQFLPNILKHRQKVTSLLGFSSACIPSILSGKYPDEHGQWNLFYYSPSTSPFGWTKNVPLVNHNFIQRIYRKIYEEVSKRRIKSDGYFETYIVPLELLHLFDISERGNIYTPGGLNKVSSIFDWMVRKNVNYRAYNYRQGIDFDLVDKATVDMKKSDLDVVFLYLSQIDSFLHAQCTDRSAVDQKIDAYENKLSDFYHAATAQGRKANLYIFSDHGMVPTTSTLDIIKIIEGTNLKHSEEFLAMYDSTMARFWCFTDHARTVLTEVLRGIDQGVILSEEYKKREHIQFQNDQYGEILFLLKPGVLIEPCYMGNTAPVGMHGCDVGDPFSDAMLMSSHPVELERKDITAFHYLMKHEIEKNLVG